MLVDVVGVAVADVWRLGVSIVRGGSFARVATLFVALRIAGDVLFVLEGTSLGRSAAGVLLSVLTPVLHQARRILGATLL